MSGGVGVDVILCCYHFPRVGRVGEVYEGQDRLRCLPLLVVFYVCGFTASASYLLEYLARFSHQSHLSHPKEFCLSVRNSTGIQRY